MSARPKSFEGPVIMERWRGLTSRHNCLARVNHLRCSLHCVVHVFLHFILHSRGNNPFSLPICATSSTYNFQKEGLKHAWAAQTSALNGRGLGSCTTPTVPGSLVFSRYSSWNARKEDHSNHVHGCYRSGIEYQLPNPYSPMNHYTTRVSMYFSTCSCPFDSQYWAAIQEQSRDIPVYP